MCLHSGLREPFYDSEHKIGTRKAVHSTINIMKYIFTVE